MSAQAATIPRRQVAAILGVNVRTIHLWVKDGTAVPTFTAPGRSGNQVWSKHDVSKLAKAKGRTPDWNQL